MYGDPSSIKSLDPAKISKKQFNIRDENIELENQLDQSRVAKDCAEWIKRKVEIRSVKKINFLHGKLYHINNSGVEDAIVGSSNFTMRGLGLSKNKNIELNLEVDSKRDRKDLLTWFNKLWNNKMEDVEVADVKKEALEYLQQLYLDYSPEFIYYKTLYYLFYRFIEEQKSADLLTEGGTLKDTQIWNQLFDFQKDAVKSAVNKINTHNAVSLPTVLAWEKLMKRLQ